jgi:hypothetical protein
MPPPKNQPRPDPVSLEAIFYYLTTAGVSLDSRAYHLVALSTVAFQSEVKARIAERPDVIKAIAMFLMQRDRAAFECRWETLGLIGELCRREAREDLAGQRASVVNAPATKCASAFVDIPWLRSALTDITAEEGDKDVPIVAKDILSALPETNEGWNKDQRDKCVDLMFLDATTQFIPLIPLVSRSDPLACAHCKKTAPPATSGSTTSTSFATPYLRCSSCKAVYYCSQECQVAHWKVAHKLPCQSYKARAGEMEKTTGGTTVALEPSLFFETRRFIYDQRDESMSSVDYESFFMKYATHVAS